MGTVQTANKHWRWQEALSSTFGQGFSTPAEHAASDEPKQKATIRFVFVEDSGEEYFTDRKAFNGWDPLLKELCQGGFQTGEVAIRVCIGQAAPAEPLLKSGTHTARHIGNTPIEMLALRAIGKATDGGPCIRLAAINLDAVITALNV